jgi:hypothetical protein
MHQSILMRCGSEWENSVIEKNKDIDSTLWNLAMKAKAWLDARERLREAAFEVQDYSAARANNDLRVRRRRRQSTEKALEASIRQVFKIEAKE